MSVRGKHTSRLCTEKTSRVLVVGEMTEWTLSSGRSPSHEFSLWCEASKVRNIRFCTAEAFPEVDSSH